jgi:hypothetical protein
MIPHRASVGRGSVVGLSVALLSLASLACGSNSPGGGFDTPDGGSPSSEASTHDATQETGSDAPTFGSDGDFDALTTGQVAEVFGESASTLYKLDPVTKAVTVVGQFQGCDDVIDIALDKDSNMYGTTYDGVYVIDRTTAVCTLIASGTNYPNSLSFVPAGTVDPTEEALVGYQGDQYVRIDTTTGALSNIGTTIGMGFSSSGDIVSVKASGSNPTYLTVKGPGCATDCLLQVDPSTGAFLKNWGPTGYSNVFGLAFWAGTVYGFDDGGDLFQIGFSGQALQVQAIPIPTAPPMLSFFGAGSTTSAPPAASM